MDSLDPATHENGFMIALTHGYNNYMTEVAADGSLAGQIAESWEPSSDVGTWTFKLRQGVTFHNGREVTAEDVVASINHHRGEDSKSAAKPSSSRSPTSRPTASTPWSSPSAPETPTSRSSSATTTFPSSRARAARPTGQSGIGAGAYRIKSFDPGVRSDLERYADYWDSGRGHFDEIQMITIVDPTARTNALITGQVDAIDRVDLKTVHLLKRRAGLTVHSIAGTQHYTFPMRTNVAPSTTTTCGWPSSTRSTARRWWRRSCRASAWSETTIPSARASAFFAKDLEQRTYDPDKAKHYLKQAGMDSLTVDLSVADAAFAGAVDAGALFAESAKAAGITLNLIREPNDGYWSNVWNSKPFCACYWGGRPVEDQMFSTAYASGAAWNDTAWEHERFNMLLVEARAEVDEAKRREMYAEMQQLVRDEGGVIVPMFASYVFATSDKVATPEQMGSNWDLDGERWMERWSFA